MKPEYCIAELDRWTMTCSAKKETSHAITRWKPRQLHGKLLDRIGARDNREDFNQCGFQ